LSSAVYADPFGTHPSRRVGWRPLYYHYTTPL